VQLGETVHRSSVTAVHRRLWSVGYGKGRLIPSHAASCGPAIPATKRATISTSAKPFGVPLADVVVPP
jgi:hypothetical protein